ncbi:unnamed protein product [Polarella glacialis]|uniref:Uncharacterized protein n=1 Tax=Polarella glacialis TaxID=89957 RepID=A0A813IKG5_POLGL|nr:unnamed protein product [Polarella glacialis]
MQDAMQPAGDLAAAAQAQELSEEPHRRGTGCVAISSGRSATHDPTWQEYLINSWACHLAARLRYNDKTSPLLGWSPNFCECLCKRGCLRQSPISPLGITPSSSKARFLDISNSVAQASMHDLCT